MSVLGSLMSGCALPSLEGRSESCALSAEEAAGTRLGQSLQASCREHLGKTGVYALGDPDEAFAIRIQLAAAAERTLDVQYYIWHADVPGLLFLHALYRAAERGVRVRMLLDDNGVKEMDSWLAMLNEHPNVEVRLFNPFMERKFKLADYLMRFSRTNRRMHNKSFTVDNQVCVVGGRNIGDEYFGGADGVEYADLDVAAVGAVVPAVSENFDRYWRSDCAFPAERLMRPSARQTLGDIDRIAEETRSRESAEGYLQAVSACRLVDDLLASRLRWSWSSVTLLSDDPCKGLGDASDDDLLMVRVEDILGQPEKCVELVSPYFVPTRRGASAFIRLARRGVQVRILTNSLEATDEAAVHAGYEKYRKALLRAGVQLFEMTDVEGRGGRKTRLFGSSGSSSLHAKTFAIDSKRMFVGSFNFDPRSARLNTEMGLMIEDPELAGEVGKLFDEFVPDCTYEVRLTRLGRLYWLRKKNGTIIRYRHEPEAKFMKRVIVRVVSWLPVEWLL